MATRKSAVLLETPNEASFSEDLPEWFTAVEPPYSVGFDVEGTKPYLFNRYNADLVDSDTETARRKKKGPPIESMVTFNEDGELCAPGEQFRMALIHAAKNYRNPRAKVGTLATVFREGLVAETELCSFGVKKWDFQDSRRARHSQSFVTKIRPGLVAGWKLSAVIGVLLPQYITAEVLHHVLVDAGRIGGVGDGRLLGYGRFIPTRFEVITGS